MEEVWKTIPGLRCYEASDLGHIRRIGATKPLKGSCDRDGYMQVRLSENNIQFTKKVHRLVALSFLENPNNYPMVNHKNEIRDDNRVDNLEWCSAKYNSHYSAKNIYHDSIIHRMKPVVRYDCDWRKTEEYRVIKPYWVVRFFQNNSNIIDVKDLASCLAGRTDLLKGYINTQRIILKPYTHVLFVKGYPKGNKPSVEKEIESITIGRPKKGMCPDKWLDTEFFIIKFE